MLTERIEKEYKRWLDNTSGDVLEELKHMNEDQIEDAFYRDLVFGTGGLRGVIGAGSNRMNLHVVAKASQGLAEYLLANGSAPSVVIGYDSRIKSDVFAKVAAGVFAANGIRVHIWPQLLPVPTVSFAVRELHASAGIMITASHNPSKYNGYKAYGPDGCQITTEAASEVLDRIKALDIFTDVKECGFEEGMNAGKIEYIDMSVLTSFIGSVKDQSLLFGDDIDKDVAIVYSPLNGAGLVPVTRVLKESGFNNITVVEEQKNPDGNFPTCPYPNPEIREAMELGLKYCEKTGADLLLATDPDCDRCGIAEKLMKIYSTRHGQTNYNKDELILGTTDVELNETGIAQALELAEKIAESYGVETVNVLTGFKFIGEVIGRLEKSGRAGDYICGFEESYGYLTGTYVRDKDAVNAAFIICEMFAFYKTRGISLIGKLNELYSKFGYCLNTLHSYEFPGSSGAAKMQSVMETFHSGLDEIAGMKVIRTDDYSTGLNGLPKSDVLKYFIDCGSVVVRPSGTEPKLKLYISVTAENREAAENVEKQIKTDIERFFNME